MSAKTLKDIAAKIAKIDMAMLTTQTSQGQQRRPIISNFGSVEYAGNSYYFTHEGSRTVQDITENPSVSLSFEGPQKLSIFIDGTAQLIRQMSIMQKHWLPDLEAWFKVGLNTPGVVLVHVQATSIKYCEGEEKLELLVSN